MEKLGKYTGLERLGRGTMGVVYRATDASLGTVAIKVMSSEVAGNPVLRHRFLREARVAASLDHPNIVLVHGMGEEEGRPYIVMEYLEGEDLKMVIARRPGLALERRLKLMNQVASALAYAHRKGIAHRDVKPENIFVTRAGCARILDFGIARVKDSTMTATGVALGTPAYMSPEQALGRKVDRRSDIFAAGAVFYELLTGERAFPGKRVPEIFDAVISRDPPPIHRRNELLPLDLSSIIQKAMAKDPRQRYQSMEAMLSHLERFEATLAGLRDKARAEAESRLAALGELQAGSGRRMPSDAYGLELPADYFGLRALIQQLGEERAHTGALLGELRWVDEVAAAPLQGYGVDTLRRMANRVDEIRTACPEASGVTRLGRLLLDELRDRVQLPAPVGTDPTGSGELGLST